MSGLWVIQECGRRGCSSYYLCSVYFYLFSSAAGRTHACTLLLTRRGASCGVVTASRKTSPCNCLEVERHACIASTAGWAVASAAQRQVAGWHVANRSEEVWATYAHRPCHTVPHIHIVQHTNKIWIQPDGVEINKQCKLFRLWR